ncbi:MAG: uroporphyrinogen-III C-methyltransferase [Deltaproteobacteria bacterium]|nr:uroporphyrinogen-III C-methyltransferase [Deltaproteobacteria bacterium]
MSGKVYLVGAGPGDPLLLTLKGARCLAECEVVVYDYLANPQLLALASPAAEMIYVGKKGGDHTMGQEDINELLCRLAAEGKVVTRLKGGDPYVFGRGGEEASALHAAGLAFEVVPGVTSAIAAPSYAGIPVTDRRHTTDVAFVTGHEDPTKPESTLNWASLAGIGTLVFLMGVKNLPHICESLIAAGRAPDTPAACVRWGTTPRQEVVEGDLTTLPAAVAAAGLQPPAITVVGGVASLRSELSWFEKLPLFGKRVLVTRARAQAGRLSGALAALGAQVVEIPTIQLGPPPDPAPLARAAAGVEAYDWLMFTSPNGVEAFFAALAAAGKDARALGRARLAVIGPATAAALAVRGLIADVTARTFVAEGLLEALGPEGVRGKRVLIPRALEAREVLPETLADWGAQVEVVPAYQTTSPPEAAGQLAEALDEGLDLITFTASSTVTNLLAVLAPEIRQRLAAATAAGEIRVATLGPITSATAREAGLTVHVEPASYTIPALVEALTRLYQAN